jgi:CRISPR-associated protein Csm1
MTDESNYLRAMAVYEEVLKVFARRAGKSAAAEGSSDGCSGPQTLALGREPTASEDTIPVLTSIVGHLQGGTATGYYAPGDIDSDKAIPLGERPTDLNATYEALWKAFEKAREQYASANQSEEVREANLLSLLQRFTWAMPAPCADSGGATDISLYDFARISAALAVCMEDEDSTEQTTAILIGGDLSGVQEWLYTFGSGGAAKSLRGRSFYLQLITEVIALSVLEHLKLPMANLLYAGGGNLYVLAPRSKKVELDTLRKELASRLLGMHQGALYVAIGSTDFTFAELMGGKVGDLWARVNGDLNTRKSRRFSELGDTAMASAIGTPLDNTGKPEDTCKVCGKTISKGERTKSLDDGRKCGLCVSFEELGNDLRTAEYLVLSRVPPKPTAAVKTWQDGLLSLGFDVQLVERDAPWRELASERSVIYYWQSKPLLSDFPGNPDHAHTVWTYRPLAQCVPLNPRREIADFEEIANASEGIPRWGVLRMDVDNLGLIFQSGIPASSLAGVVGLSGLLRLFFEGRVPQIAEALNTDGPHAYVMYAGGDDLFIVGSWSHLPDLAWRIREGLAQFAAGNPHVTISGGVSIALDDKYPLYQAARDAGSAEHKAKDAGRNALVFMGKAMKWEGGEDIVTFPLVTRRVEQIRSWLSGDDKAPRSLLMTLRAIDAEWQVWKKKEDPKSVDAKFTHSNRTLYLGPWQWHLAYSLARAGERSKKEGIKGELEEYVESIVNGEVRYLGLESRWTELLSRKHDAD